MAYSFMGCAMSVLSRVGRGMPGLALAGALALAAAPASIGAQQSAQPLVFQSISAGTNHACGLTAQHAAYCWGRNAEGQLGNPAVTSSCSDAGSPCSTKPVRVAGGLSFNVISAGNNGKPAAGNGGKPVSGNGGKPAPGAKTASRSK